MLRSCRRLSRTCVREMALMGDLSLGTFTTHSFYHAPAAADCIYKTSFNGSDLALSVEGRQLVSRKFNIPVVFWHNLTQEASGFFWADRDDSTHANGTQYATTLRFLAKKNEAAPTESVSRSSLRAYIWEKLWFITRWKSPTNWTVL